MPQPVYLSPQPRQQGCFSCFGWCVVVLGIIVCVVLTVYPTAPFHLPSFPNLFASPTPAHHTASDARVLAVNLASAQDVRGAPTLSAAFVNQVLAAAHSPAQGTGDTLYALSKQYGIDNAYALAFFQHESQFGTTGMARVTHSLGNIRCSAGYACVNGYRAYTSWQAGEQDWYSLIADLYVRQWHLTTIEQILPVYAPTSDGNDVAAYIAAVEQDVTRWHRGEV